MKAEDLCLLLTGYSFTVAFAAVAELLQRRRVASLINVVMALAAVSATAAIGYFLEANTPYLGLLWWLIEHGDMSSVTAVGMGVAAGLVWIVRLAERLPASYDDASISRPRRCLVHFLLVASIAGFVLGGLAFLWKEYTGYERDVMTRIRVPEFVIEQVAAFEYPPLCVAAGDDGKVYVSYSYSEEWGDVGGAIIELSRDRVTGEYQQRTVADSPFLMRTYGLAVWDGSLYVSRSGIAPQTKWGTVSYASTGAVTQLKDTDEDGYFEYAHDVVTGLPGARGPDTMQQNNGIAFGPDGSLFVTNACSTNRSLDEHRWGGVILRASPDFSQTEIFAEGFRNPFGVAIGPDDELFVTDNDVDDNPGDELNHVVQGDHYGHPFVVPREDHVEPSGFRDPILTGDPKSQLLGMAYATSPALPEEYRNCIYLADFQEHAVLRVALARSGDTYEVTGVDRLASVSEPVDIAVTPAGEFFVISRNGNRVLRISLKNAQESHE